MKKPSRCARAFSIPVSRPSGGFDELFGAFFEFFPALVGTEEILLSGELGDVEG
jgi:hypothetical protein